MLRASNMSDPGSSPPRAAEASERSARERSVVAVLRQLWLGLATYRLYPENPQRPGFAAATGRIGAAVAEALVDGPVDVEVRGDRFALQGTPLPTEEALERLALACFERRVERLAVTSAPTLPELETLYATLSRPAAELAEAGAVDEMLRNGGVTFATLSAIGPGTVEEADHVPPELAEAEASGRLDADVLASELMVEDLHGSPADQAETLLARIRRVVGDEATDAPSIDVHSSVHDLLANLSGDVRRSLVEILVDRVRDDPVAGRLIGTMSNAELTRALVDIGAGGRDPVALARELATAGVRQVDIVDLTKALEAGHEDAGTIIAGLEQLGIDLGEGGGAAPGGSVMELLSEYLTATAGDDSGSIREGIAATGEEMRTAQVMAVADYLALESDLERAGEALGIWSDELRRAVANRDEREVAALLQPVRAVLLSAGEERPALFEGYVRRALAREVVLDAVTAEATDGHPHLAALLSPFGDHGVDVLLDLLAEEEDRHRRALLLGALRRIAHDHPRRVVARLSDARWFVVRNAVSILGSSRNPSVLPRLVQAASHAAPEVRREVPEAVANAGGPEAAPHLAGLAVDGPDDVRGLAVTSLGTLVGEEAAGALADVAARSRDRSIREQALHALAERAEGPEHLRRLASGEAGTRLPWRLRRLARRLAARGDRGRP
jgi:hypothetical protein